jgi:hypothetical protein
MIFLKTLRSDEGLPVSGFRAWMWTMEAPAWAAWIAESAISCGVIGRLGLKEGTVDAPVIAAVMIKGSIFTSLFQMAKV